MPYAWRCSCGTEIPAEPTGYRDMCAHLTEEHPGEHGMVRGLVDADSGEIVVAGFGPRKLQEAQKKGFLPHKGRNSGGGGGGRGSGGGSDSKMQPAGRGISTTQTTRKVALHLPTLETLFQFDRQTFSEGWDDSDEGFSLWLHDVVIHSHRPHALAVLGIEREEVEEVAAQRPPDREALARVVLDPSRLPDDEVAALESTVFEALAWWELLRPYREWRGVA